MGMAEFMKTVKELVKSKQIWVCVDNRAGNRFDNRFVHRLDKMRGGDNQGFRMSIHMGDIAIYCSGEVWG